MHLKKKSKFRLIFFFITKNIEIKLQNLYYLKLKVYFKTVFSNK